MTSPRTAAYTYKQGAIIRVAAIIPAALTVLTLSLPARAASSPPDRALTHARHVVQFFDRHPDLAATTKGHRALFAAIGVIDLKQARKRMSLPGQARLYTKELAAQMYGWTGYQWDALDWIGMRESHWDPCAYNPMGHNCWHSGSTACGVPQANPCPSSWRGRLGDSWMEQCRWFLSYIHGRYGSPAVAKGYWLRNGSY